MSIEAPGTSEDNWRQEEKVLMQQGIRNGTSSIDKHPMETAQRQAKEFARKLEPRAQRQVCREVFGGRGGAELCHGKRKILVCCTFKCRGVSQPAASEEAGRQLPLFV